MKIYLAGPMRGYPDFNFPAFNRWAAVLREDGHEVMNPADDPGNGVFEPGAIGSDELMAGQGVSLRRQLGLDLAWICEHAEAVVVMDGWRDSAGAKAEVHTAWALRIPVFCAPDFALLGTFAGQVTTL